MPFVDGGSWLCIKHALTHVRTCRFDIIEMCSSHVRVLPDAQQQSINYVLREHAPFPGKLAACNNLYGKRVHRTGITWEGTRIEDFPGESPRPVPAPPLDHLRMRVG